MPIAKPASCVLQKSHPLARGIITAIPFDHFPIVNSGTGKTIKNQSYTWSVAGTPKKVYDAYGAALDVDNTGSPTGNRKISFGSDATIISSLGTTTRPDFTICYLGTLRTFLSGQFSFFFRTFQTGFGNQLELIWTDATNLQFQFDSNYDFPFDLSANLRKALRIVFSKRGTNATLYVNGSVISSQTLDVRTVTGDDTQEKYFEILGGDGWASEFRLYDRGLSHLEVLEDYIDPFAIYRQAEEVYPGVAASGGGGAGGQAARNMSVLRRRRRG